VSVQTLDRPFVAGAALRSVNFFNGRLLTGDDLRVEQATQAARLERLGEGLGDGIAYGFEVEETLGSSTNAEPVVTIARGLAVARSGAALELTTDVEVSLVRRDPPAGAEPGALFADCQPFAPGTYTAGAGVYVLTVAPSQQGEGRAQASGLGNDVVPCNIARSAEALKFRLIRLALPLSELADKELLRNRIAYACFGTNELAEFVADPFGLPPTTYGLIDTLRKQTLTDDEVPLAVIGWSIDDGIQFVDLWSVRRRLTRRSPEGDWSGLVSDRRRAEAEAMFLQFQAQLADLTITVDALELFEAASPFELLPAAGLLPVEGIAVGFDSPTFFTGLTTRGPFFIEAALVAPLLRASFSYPPIDLSSGELIWLYEVHENRDSLVAGAGLDRPFVLFASGFIPYAANPRFDLAHWDFANFALDFS
jgi:hypothetical protein